MMTSQQDVEIKTLFLEEFITLLIISLKRLNIEPTEKKLLRILDGSKKTGVMSAFDIFHQDFDFDKFMNKLSLVV